MRLVGALLFVLGGAGCGYATWAALSRRRPQDVVFAALAPVAILVAIAGLLLVFVPRFFGG